VGPTTCPNEDLLIAFVLGHLSEVMLMRVAEHVETCSDCETRLGTLDGLTDSILAALRHLSTAQREPERSRNTLPNPE
jgi:hypothetical protein